MPAPRGCPAPGTAQDPPGPGSTSRSERIGADNGRVPTSVPDPALPVLDVLLTPEGRALVESLTPYDPATAMARLAAARATARWVDHPDVVAAAATQARLRTRASARFPGPSRWWTPDGLEQATRPAVATRHARRFTDAGLSTVADLGCGVGSDALAMAAAGLAVHAVDRDPQALWALAATASDLGLAVRTTLGDVTMMPGEWNEVDPHDVDRLGCFIDPARRAASGRTLAPQTWSPPWSWVRSLARRVPATGAKVAPGIDHAALGSEVQAEWISVGGDLVEAGVWWGPLRQGAARRQATVLSASAPPEDPAARRWIPTVLDDTDGIPEPEIGPVQAWLVEPDPAVIRSGLVSVLADRVGGHLLDRRIAYIVAGTEPEPGALGTTFAVLAEVPFARKAMRTWLRTHGYCDVVVKKRGVNVVPEQLRAALRLRGDGPTATLVLTRTDAGPLALLVDRVDPGSRGPSARADR